MLFEFGSLLCVKWHIFNCLQSRGIIDGELVFSYSDLPYLQKNEIARKIGTRLVDIMDDLAELDRMAAHF